MLTSLLTSLVVGLPLAPEEVSLHVRLETPAPATVAERLAAEDFDVLGWTANPPAVDVVVPPGRLADLRSRGLPVTIVARGRPFHDIQRERADDAGGAVPEGGVPTGYLDLAGVEAALFAAEASRPDICQIVDLTDRYATPTTSEGRHILAAKISDNVAADEDEPTFLLVSAHHSRELVTPVIALDSIDRLLAGHGSDPQITSAVDDNEIWIVPVWNPDGYDHVFTGDNLWRKNRTVFPQGTGVDLNRNYPPGWSEPCGGSTSVTSSTYRGPSPASEAETVTMIAFGTDRHFAKVLDVHSFASEIRYGYGCWNHPLDGFLLREAGVISQDAGYGGAVASSCCLGGDIHFQYAVNNALAFLPETHTTFQPTHQSAMDEAAQFWPGTLNLLSRPISITGLVTDACTNLPLGADVDVVGVDYVNGEQPRSAGPFSRYHLFLLAGTYTVQFSAPGYASQNHVVVVSDTAQVTLDVTLAPLVPAGCWTDLGNALAGNAGPPALIGRGTLEPDTTATLELTSALPGGTTTLVLGFADLSAPFKQGVLVPRPDVLIAGLPIDADGELIVSFPWPAGIPSGLQIFYQYWHSDPAGPVGFAASNAVESTAP